MATVTGIEQSESVIQQLISGRELSLDIIEMLACEGGCVDGPCMVGPWEGIARRQRLISHVEQAGKGLPDGCLSYGSEGEDGSLPAWLARTFADRD